MYTFAFISPINFISYLIPICISASQGREEYNRRYGIQEEFAKVRCNNCKSLGHLEKWCPKPKVSWCVIIRNSRPVPIYCSWIWSSRSNAHSLEQLSMKFDRICTACGFEQRVNLMCICVLNKSVYEQRATQTLLFSIWSFESMPRFDAHAFNVQLERPSDSYEVWMKFDLRAWLRFTHASFAVISKTSFMSSLCNCRITTLTQVH